MSDSPALRHPVATLFPDSGERERIDRWLTHQLTQALERVAAGPVTPTVDISQLRDELAAFDFSGRRPIEDVLAWAMAQLERGTVHLTHPRYFGLFNPAPNFPSQCADRLVSAFNPQLASSGSSPAPIEIEAHVIRAVAARAGLPVGSGGHFTTSGSEANFTALLCALSQAEPRFVSEGLRAFRGPITLYASRECHAAWFKIALQAGAGRNALRLVASDGCGRMSVTALADAIERDRAAGRVPVMIAATAGTTGAGMIDPLEPCARIAREQRLWYHVDAAWGGAALCSQRLRGLLAGIELADSLTIDAHKWFATTMGCGMFIARDPRPLSEVFRVAADFMPSNASSLDPYLTTLQWSRRFVGLRLFLTLATAGWQDLGAHVERATQVVDSVREGLTLLGWSVANTSELAVLCVVPPSGSRSVREIARRVVGSGSAWVAATAFEGHDVVRICATHGETALADVEALVGVLGDAARTDQA